MTADALRLYFAVADKADRESNDQKAIDEAVRKVDELLSDDGGIYKAEYGVVNQKMIRQRTLELGTLMCEGRATEWDVIEFHNLCDALKYNACVKTFRFYFGRAKGRFIRPLQIKEWWHFDRMIEDIAAAMEAR